MTEAERLVAAEFNTLRGRVLGLIESWGLPEKQELGCKATFKTLTYDSQARILETLNASNDEHPRQ
jgi:hypothetical protein